MPKSTTPHSTPDAAPDPTATPPTEAPPAPLLAATIARAVAAAFAEDLAETGDITSQATVPGDRMGKAVLAARAGGVISGLDVAAHAFAALDPQARFTRLTADGALVAGGSRIAVIEGSARGLLAAERVALNFMGRMSGIATLTHAYVERVAGTRASILDTRKTTPGLRAFEKYAVACGGGRNHRFGLYDAILIKDNHIVAAGGIDAAIRSARARCGHLVKIEVEVDTLAQLALALAHRIDAVLLDNMSLADLSAAVATVKGRVLTEASGGVSLATVRAIAGTGVDMISVGALTHSAPVLDLGLDFT